MNDPGMNSSSVIRSYLPTAGSLALFIGSGFLLYGPGFDGWFLLDDIPVLEVLERLRFHPLRERLLLFVLGGDTGPLGRPLSMLSFLINDYGWPSDPAPFRYTNLCLHLITGLLVYWFLLLLTSRMTTLSERKRQLLSFVTAFLWLIHPLQTSTVLYVVQRMTLLSSLFMAAGLVLYLKGRIALEGGSRQGYVSMTAGLVLGTGLGMLSKEIAVMLPLYVLVCEYTLVRAGAGSLPRAYRLWRVLFLWLPIVVLVLWHVANIERFAGSFGARNFTMAERLYTEPRVLFIYLAYILFPKRQGTGLFHDDIEISHGLSDPGAAIPIAAWLILAITALLARRRWPVFGFAVLWFLAGHALEAGPLSLELYFEHRNYLPMLGPLFLLVYGGFTVTPKLQNFVRVAFILYLGIAAQATYQNAQLWHNIPMLAHIWAEEHPNSARAKAFLAHQWVLLEKWDEAEAVLREVIRNVPRNTNAPVSIIYLRCLSGKPVQERDWNETYAALSHGVQNTATVEMLDKIGKLIYSGKCPQVPDGRFFEMLERALKNPSFQNHPRVHAALHYLAYGAHMSRGDLVSAAESLEMAFKAEPSFELALQRARIYTQIRRYDAARSAIAEAAALDRHPIWGIPLHSWQIRDWHEFIAACAASDAASKK